MKKEMLLNLLMRCFDVHMMGQVEGICKGPTRDIWARDHLEMHKKLSNDSAVRHVEESDMESLFLLFSQISG